MRAIAFDAFGAEPAALDLPVPEAGPGEVLVRVRNSSVNGFDLGALGGYLRGVYEYEFPVVPGKDFAGTIAAIGPGAEGFGVGDEVFGVVMRPTLGQGGWSEYVAVPAGYGVAALPVGVDHATAGALGLAGTAALNSVDAVAVLPGETVLISGATGGVGAIAVQLAAARGATVLATARPGAEAEFVTRLGATHVVDRTAGLDAQVRAIAPDGVHAALHFAGDGAAVAETVRAGGRFASTVHFAPDDAAERDIKATVIMSDPSRDTLTRLAGQVAEGLLVVPIAARYPLAETPRAVADFTAGTLGKLGIDID
ncbi:NADP-dependent oxidoreductase [Nocardia inohanensis]|uniref:NADP-dependent oxidoreductase n=1 Tax=Nocardia inohanensis TaxID=209246 RepID=UPI00082C9D45|nr:NADP-dependent oxidoreductase [Nocardia inohanensis]